MAPASKGALLNIHYYYYYLSVQILGSAVIYQNGIQFNYLNYYKQNQNVTFGTFFLAISSIIILMLQNLQHQRQHALNF